MHSGLSVLAASVMCALVACGDGSGTDASPAAAPQRPVEYRSDARQRFDASGAETFLVYSAAGVRATGRLIARAKPDETPRLSPSPTVTVIVFREIPEKLSKRAAELGVGAGGAYLVTGDLEAAVLDDDPLETSLAFERLRDVDLALTDEALAEAVGMKMQAPPDGTENGLAFLAGDDVRLPFYLWVRSR